MGIVIPHFLYLPNLNHVKIISIMRSISYFCMRKEFSRRHLRHRRVSFSPLYRFVADNSPRKSLAGGIFDNAESASHHCIGLLLITLLERGDLEPKYFFNCLLPNHIHVGPLFIRQNIFVFPRYSNRNHCLCASHSRGRL